MLHECGCASVRGSESGYNMTVMCKTVAQVGCACVCIGHLIAGMNHCKVSSLSVNLTQ